MGEVAGLFFSIRHRLPMKAVEEIEAIANKGFKGCAHGRPGSPRQLLLVELETLEALGLKPGEIKENVTTRGVALARLKRGQQLRVGKALLEVTLPCGPCGRMDDIRSGLQQELRGRRGILCRVLEGGRVRCGDAVTVLDAVEVVS